MSRKGHHHFHSDGQWSLVFKEGAEESVVVSLNSQKCLNALCTLSSIGIFKSLCSFWFFSGIFPSNVWLLPQCTYVHWKLSYSTCSKWQLIFHSLSYPTLFWKRPTCHCLLPIFHSLSYPTRFWKSPTYNCPFHCYPTPHMVLKSPTRHCLLPTRGFPPPNAHMCTGNSAKARQSAALTFQPNFQPSNRMLCVNMHPLDWNREIQKWKHVSHNIWAIQS